jgi:hypothetical protein
MTTLTTMTKIKTMMMTMMMMVMMMTTTTTHNMSSTWKSFIHKMGCRFVGSVSSLNLCNPTWLAEQPTLPSVAEKKHESQ